MLRPTPAFLSLALAGILQAQSPFPAAAPVVSPVPVLASYPDTPAGKLLKEIKEHSEVVARVEHLADMIGPCLLYTSPSPRDGLLSRMPSSA